MGNLLRKRERRRERYHHHLKIACAICYEKERGEKEGGREGGKGKKLCYYENLQVDSRLTSIDSSKLRHLTKCASLTKNVNYSNIGYCFFKKIITVEISRIKLRYMNLTNHAPSLYLYINSLGRYCTHIAPGLRVVAHSSSFQNSLKKFVSIYDLGNSPSLISL